MLKTGEYKNTYFAIAVGIARCHFMISLPESLTFAAMVMKKIEKIYDVIIIGAGTSE